MTRSRATAIGFSAVALWALLALMTVASAPVPPLQLSALTFAIGGAVGLAWLFAKRELDSLRQIPLRVYAFGTLGLFCYHALYFTALRLAPPAEAGLICYLWPLLIVLFSGFLPGETLRRGHIIGAVLGFMGAALIIAGGMTRLSGSILGYGVALIAALTWALYSLGSRRLDTVPTAAVAVYCIATALLASAAHLAFETTMWPETPWGFAAIIGLGLGPVGLAFYTWDVGVKLGDIQLLGTASYAAPLLSTLALVGAGMASATWTLGVAAALITGGAAIAARATRRVSPSPDA